MFATLAPTLTLISLAILALAALFHLGVALVPRRRRRRSEAAGAARVVVLVPCHEEALNIVPCVESLLAQDTLGATSVWVLVADEDDSGARALRAHFTVMPERVRIVSSALRPKADKLAHALKNGARDFDCVAFLDADHRAEPEWIARSLAMLAEDTTLSGVQSRRGAIATHGVARAWDGAEGHIGHESLNNACDALGASVAFTGTTAVFRVASLPDDAFVTSSVTEDTDLSFRLWSHGARIAYSSELGSREELAPSLSDYVRRRRRWAAGHTVAFVTHAAAVMRAPLSLLRKLALSAYGCFFLLAPAVWLQLVPDAAFTLAQLPLLPALAVVGAASAGSVLLAWRLRLRGTVRALVVGFLLLTPIATPLVVLALRARQSEVYFALIAYPIALRLKWWTIALLCLPPIALIIARLRIRAMPWHHFLLALLSYPLWMIFDLYAVMLGLADVVVGDAGWQRVARDPSSAPPLNRPLLAALVLMLLALGGGGVYLQREACPGLSIHPRGAALEIDIVGHSNWALALSDDSGFWHRASAQATKHLSVPMPWLPGWDTRVLHAALSSAAGSCTRDFVISTVQKELSGKTLVVNGEPFLVKGVVPSYSAAPLSLSTDAGFEQLKAIGANAVRLYHAPSDEVLEAAARHGMLLVAQPNHSTWDNIDLESARDTRSLLGRFDSLVRLSEREPMLLLPLLGNELELVTENDSFAPTEALIEGAHVVAPGAVFGYATYYTLGFERAPIACMNLLDSGATIWSGAMQHLSARATPFLATELGGFVAFHDRIPSGLRAYNLLMQWQQLLRAGALGAIVYESHDNWAQSLPPGYANDPLSPDFPDDSRGLWTRDNSSKLELLAVQEMFLDVAVDVVEVSDAVTLSVHNTRPYALRNLQLGGMPLPDLLPLAAQTLRLPRAPDGVLHLAFSYTTHSGLPGRSKLDVRIPAPGMPVVLNRDFVPRDAPPGRVQGMLLASSEVDIAVPAGISVLHINGHDHPVRDQRVHLSVPSPYRTINDVKLSGCDTKGTCTMEFSVPWVGGGTRLLVLGGLASLAVSIKIGDIGPTVLPAHPYREIYVDLSAFGQAASGPARVEFDRQFFDFISTLAIHLDAPRVWSQVELDISWDQ